jgi:type II secretory pathway pseudopilin PulG
MFGPNTQNIKSKMAGFSLPGVLVGVALIGISATIISQTVVNSRRILALEGGQWKS